MLKVLRAVFGRQATVEDNLARTAASYKILALEAQLVELKRAYNAQTQRIYCMEQDSDNATAVLMEVSEYSAKRASRIEELEAAAVKQSATLAKHVKTIKRLRKRCTETRTELIEAYAKGVTGFDIAVAEGLGALAYKQGEPAKSALPGGGMLSPTDVAFNMGWRLAEDRKRAAETMKEAQGELVPSGVQLVRAMQAGAMGYADGHKRKSQEHRAVPLSWEDVAYNIGWSNAKHISELRAEAHKGSAKTQEEPIKPEAAPTAMEVVSMFAQGRMARAGNADKPTTTAQNATTWKGAAFNLGWFAEDDKRRLEDELKAKPSGGLTYDDALRDFLAGLNNEILPFNAARPLHGTTLYVFGSRLRDVNRAADRFKQALAKKE